ncbi:MAG TPA: BMP family protein, partial [Candidatus Bathyarchaeia archaeon]|nr:BMP family protein [Candidatus Bathyarchaeia archaeon]
AYDSIMRMKKELGLEVSVSEAVPPMHLGATLRDYAEKGFNLIWAHAYDFEEKTIRVALEYPRSYFAVSGHSTSSVSNTCLFQIKKYENYYLVGLLAGALTKKNKVGLVTGDFPGRMAPPLMQAALRAIKSVNPNVETKIDFVMDWEDRKKAKKSALDLIEWGADVLVQNGDGTSFGVYEACVEKGVLVNGEWVDHYDLAPGLMYTTALIRWDPAIREALQDIANGFVKEIYSPNLANGGLDLAWYHDFEGIIPEGVKRMVQQAKQEIIQGKIYIRG